MLGGSSHISLFSFNVGFGSPFVNLTQIGPRTIAFCDAIDYVFNSNTGSASNFNWNGFNTIQYAPAHLMNNFLLTGLADYTTITTSTWSNMPACGSTNLYWAQNQVRSMPCLSNPWTLYARQVAPF